MSERRMFAKTIIDSDAFLDMPLSTQALYFHLSMRADDDGFVNNPKKIQKTIGANDDDLKMLIAKRFILDFDTGIIVIKHWKIHNYIQSDRYKPTVYQEEKNQLITKNNKSYTRLSSEQANLLENEQCIQNVYKLDTQVRLGKYSKDTYSRETAKEIIEYLNQKTGKEYRHDTHKTTELIQARMNEGFKLEDFKKVIDIKTSQWKNDTAMNKFLRPLTLFSNKFESYLNETPVKVDHKTLADTMKVF